MQLPNEMRLALKTRPVTEVEKFFDDFLKSMTPRLMGCQTTEDMQALKAKMEMVQEFRTFFLTEMQR